MPELICEIGASSWFYYKEMNISVHRSEVVCLRQKHAIFRPVLDTQKPKSTLTS
jgi:hypothetical protein